MLSRLRYAAHLKMRVAMEKTLSSIWGSRQCGEFEIRTSVAAASEANFKFEKRTGNMDLLVTFFESEVHSELAE